RRPPTGVGAIPGRLGPQPLGDSMVRAGPVAGSQEKKMPLIREVIGVPVLGKGGSRSRAGQSLRLRHRSSTLVLAGGMIENVAGGRILPQTPGRITGRSPGKTMRMMSGECSARQGLETRGLCQFSSPPMTRRSLGLPMTSLPPF
ncbi:unnamed protein product, partial [Symbiodinium sp. CCMP2456]